MSLLNEIDPLKQTALAELKAAPDLAALEQTKGAWIGPNGKFTMLMKQLGTLPRGERPAAGKAINDAKEELKAALNERRDELELKAAQPKEPTDFTLPGRRRALGKLHPLTQVTEDIVRSFRKIGFVVSTARKSRTNIIASTPLTRLPTTLLAIRKTRFISTWLEHLAPTSVLPARRRQHVHSCSVLIRHLSKSA